MLSHPINLRSENDYHYDINGQSPVLYNHTLDSNRAVALLYYLFQIDALPTRIGSCDYLHKAVLVTRECVIWNKVINTQLLQRVSSSFYLKHSFLC